MNRLRNLLTILATIMLFSSCGPEKFATDKLSYCCIRFSLFSINKLFQPKFFSK